MDSLPIGVTVGVAIAAAAGVAYSVACRKTSKQVKGEKVFNLADLPKGTMKEVDVDGTRVILLAHTTSGKVTATSAKCPHVGARLVTGVLAGDRIVCPWHAACFNAATGDIEDGPSVDALMSFPTTVDAATGDIYVDMGVDEGKPVPMRRAPSVCDHRAAPSSKHFVLLGAGAATATAVEELRAKGFTGSITVVERANELPYDRTKLSKNPEAEVAHLRPAAFYEKLGVTLKLGVSVTGVDTKAKTVTLASGELLKYDKLLCATGGPARTFRADKGESFVLPGADAGNIFPLRDAPDAEGITALVKAHEGKPFKVVVLGSSFIGMEAAAWLVGAKRVADVTVVGMETEPFERVLGPVLGKFMRGVHEAKGVKFIMNAVAASFASNAAGNVQSVTLKSGQVLPADMVIIGAGIIPAVDYLKAAKGVQLLARAPGGVQVDETLKAADDVYVAGDIAYFPYALPGAGPAGTHLTRIEHWDVAMDQGRTAARNMLGANESFSVVPFFWTAQYGKAVRYAGHALSFQDVIVHGSLTNGIDSKWTAYFVDDDKVAAVATWNNDPVVVAARELLRLSAMPRPATLRGTTTWDPVKALKEVTLVTGGGSA